MQLQLSPNIFNSSEISVDIKTRGPHNDSLADSLATYKDLERLFMVVEINRERTVIVLEFLSEDDLSLRNTDIREVPARLLLDHFRGNRLPAVGSQLAFHFLHQPFYFNNHYKIKIIL